MLIEMAPPLERLEEAVRKHRAELVTFACRLLRDAHEAEDSVQAALARALDAIRSGEVPANFRAWLYKIVHREVLRSAEKAAVRRRPIPARPEADGTAQDPEGGARIHHRVLAEMDRLPGEYRTVLHLRFSHRLSYEEVSDALEMPVGTVKSCQARALRLLRGRLASFLEREV